MENEKSLMEKYFEVLERLHHAKCDMEHIKQKMVEKLAIQKNYHLLTPNMARIALYQKMGNLKNF